MRERDYESTDAFINTAERYMEAHRSSNSNSGITNFHRQNSGKQLSVNKNDSTQLVKPANISSYPVRRCFICSSTAHMRRDCPQQKGSSNSKSVSLSSAAEVDRGNMIIGEEYIGRHKVTVMRDTGCSSAIVARRYVSESDLTGSEVNLRLVDGTTRVVPVANIKVDTPFYSGTLSAVCLDEPVYEKL